MGKRELGRFGEDRAADYIEGKGYRVLRRNYQTRFGEIDIIAENAVYLVFLEVKLRKNAAFAAAREFVTRAKQEKIILTARQFLLELPGSGRELQPRFDVIEIYAPEGENSALLKINHIENAFQ